MSRARKELPQLPRNGVVLGYLGVLRPSTAKIMFGAFEYLKKQVGGPCRLVLIGNHKLDVDAYIPKSCREDVIQTGWLSYEQINLFLSASNSLLLPLERSVSTDNVWPSKLNDYLAAGRPVVATSMRILQPLFESHPIGLLTPDEPKEFALGCLEVIGSPDRCVTMGNCARALAEGDLAWTSTVDRLENFYQKVLSARR